MYPQQQPYPPQPNMYAPNAQTFPTHPYPQNGDHAPQPTAPVMPNFVDPSAGGGGDWSPLPRHLIGYAVAILPTAYDPNNAGVGGQGVRPQITADFVVVGVDPQGNPLPPVEYGDSQSRNAAEQRPNCFRLDAFPAEFRGARWTNEAIVNALKAQVGTGNVVLGRFRIGDQGNRPPLLEVMQPNDAARQALAAAWQQRAQDPNSLRRTVGNGITEINGGPPKKDAAPGQGYPATGAPQPGVAYTQQPQHWGGPVAPPMPPQPGAQVAYPPPPQQPAAPAPQGGMPPAAAAAGWTQAAWDAAPPPVKAQFGG